MKYLLFQNNSLHLDTVAAPWIVPNFASVFFNQQNGSDCHRLKS